MALRPYITVALAFLLGAHCALATTFTVTSALDEVDAKPGDGVCATASKTCTLRAAVQEADALPGDDAIDLPPGPIVLTLAGADEFGGATGSLDVNGGNLTITGAGAPKTIIDGNQLDRVLAICGGPAGCPKGASLTLAGVTVRNGKASGAGGGILVDRGGLLKLQSSTITGNSAKSGGGIAIVSRVTADFAPASEASLSDCAITNNTGGGIAVSGIDESANAGRLSIEFCTVNGNTTSGSGGGVLLTPGELTLLGSTISGNTADGNGGGVANEAFLTSRGNNQSFVDAIDSTVSGNSAGGFGGGVYNSGTATLQVSADADVSLQNVTVTDNRADADANGTGDGGGVFSTARGPDAIGLVAAANSIIAGNKAPQAPDCATSAEAPLVEQGFNLLGTLAGCVTSGTSVGRATGNPGLAPLADNGGPTRTHALLPGSPALDAGNTVPLTGVLPCAAVDQRGVGRPRGSSCDMGAYERTVCGDEAQDLDEECDDGNTRSGDGCSSTCRIEAPTTTTTSSSTSTTSSSTTSTRPTATTSSTSTSSTATSATTSSTSTTSSTTSTSSSTSTSTSTSSTTVVPSTTTTTSSSSTSSTAAPATTSSTSTTSSTTSTSSSTSTSTSTSSSTTVVPSTTTTTLGGPRCGNGIPEAGEECDDGARNSDTLPNACRTSCRRAHCGDGVLDTVELCDDGVNGTPNDCCDDTCRPRRLRQPCGDDGESACDHADSCDSNGVCRPNFAEDGTECPADELDCTEDVCDGGGRCVHRPGNKGFQCRVKGAQDECDAGDVCDGASAECPLTHANAGCQATTPDEVRKAIPVTCEVQADTVQGGKSSCDAAGFEVTGGATPRAVPPAGLTLGRRVTVALKPGQKKLPKPDAAGVKRKVLKLKLNSRGKQLLKSQGSLRVLVRVTVRHGGLVRQLETLVRVVGGG